MDTLKENTTYTIDFTNSISDNNEKNVLENYSFAFSTGESIDSMEVSGVLLNAENLEPMPGITIGVHTNLEDSAFTTIPFVRTSRTNDKGEFTIRNMAPGTYRICLGGCDALLQVQPARAADRFLRFLDRPRVRVDDPSGYDLER